MKFQTRSHRMNININIVSSIIDENGRHALKVDRLNADAVYQIFKFFFSAA